MRFPRLAVVCLAALCFLELFGVAVARAQQPEGTPPVFEFHSGFWLNLHHVLYLQGRARKLAGQSGLGGTPAAKQELPVLATDGLSAEQQHAWSAAVDAYAADWSARDLQLNGDMAVVSNRLGELENCGELSGQDRPDCKADLREDLVAALDEAAPIYRARWWSEQDRENRAWIADVAPLVRRMGTTLSTQLTEIYQSGWPREAIRVDVVWSAGPLGAYTTQPPLHVTVASSDTRNQGAASFEVLFDESSHALAGALNQAIARECRQRGKPIPRDLWQAVLYYTAREITRRIDTESARPARNGASSGIAGSGSAPDRNALYDPDWSRYRGLLESYWQSYLDGKGTFDIAVSRMIAAL